MNKPKRPQPEKQEERQERDFFQTPNYATDLILPYLPDRMWECAAGNGKMADRIESTGRTVYRSDIETGQNFLTIDEPNAIQFNGIVTNPPFSLKRKFWEKCLFHNVPFALLLPVDFCGWILREMQDNKNQWLIPTRRIDYITPTGKQGKTSSAQYHSGWFCHNMRLPKQITICELTIEMKRNI